MLFKYCLLSVCIATTGVIASLNEPCYGAGGSAGKFESSHYLRMMDLTRFLLLGVCVTESTCKSSGGVTTTSGCHSDPANVKCCTKAACSTSGNCRWTSDCAGTSVANQCPGPSAFKCCSSSVCATGRNIRTNVINFSPYRPVVLVAIKLPHIHPLVRAKRLQSMQQRK